MSPKVWLITGANSGLGLALALCVLSHGDQVIAAARNPSKLPESLKDAKPLKLDLSGSESEIKKAGQEALQIYGHIDFLVNNAGYALPSPVEELIDAEIKQQFQTNLFGPLSLIQSILPSFRDRKSGTIVNVSSVAGLAGGPGFGAYNASKAALEQASEALATELVKFNIQVLIILPGFFPTNFLGAAAAASNSSEARPTIYTDPSQGYRGVENMAARHVAAKQVGDKDKAALRIYESVTTDPHGLVRAQRDQTPWVRIQLGPDSAKRLGVKFDQFKANVELMKPISLTTDMDEEQMEAFAKSI